MRTLELEVPRPIDPERLDRWLAGQVADLSRSAIARLIDEGGVTVNGAVAKPSLKLEGGERVTVVVPDPAAAVPAAEEIPLEVLYEDSSVIVVNKPPGMVVHQGAGNFSGTLVNALLGHCDDLSGVGGELRPGIVHRIDKDTSGILVAAKNDRAHQGLAEQFEKHSIKRVYLALAYGAPKDDRGKIESTIGRHPTDRKKMSGKARHGKRAVTNYRVLGRYGQVSFLELRLETGRTHQIRVHLSEMGHPLLGDETYGGAGRINNLKDPKLRSLVKELGRQALHAKTLGFIHPETGTWMEYTSDLPEDMARIVAYLDNLMGA